MLSERRIAQWGIFASAVMLSTCLGVLVTRDLAREATPTNQATVSPQPDKAPSAQMSMNAPQSLAAVHP